MTTIVIMPGGFHPFHAGHFALYQSAKQAFPGATLYVAATNDMSERPFPFALKEKLAKLAGVGPGHFVQVKSPFQAKEITSHYNPDQDVLVFVRSEKDKTEQPMPGGTKKDGSPAYFQPWTGKNLQPFSKHAYMAYLPTVKFGPGITSATEIRKAWPTLDDRRKTAMVMSLYPATQKNPKLAQNVVGMFNQVMGGQQGVSESESRLYKHHQELRKKSGLPDPEVYKQKIKQKQAEIDALAAEIAAAKKGVAETKEQNYGSEWDKKVKRLGQMAKEGPRKTVWDPVKRVYKTVPINPPKQSSVAEAGNPAQQAAIAINMKKHHQKPKNVSEGKDYLEEK